MPIVLDANVAIDLFLPNVSEVAATALDLVVAEGAVVPALWRPITVDDELTGLFGDESAVSKRFNLSVYDAAYLELAIRLHLPLAANDRGLWSAAKAAKLAPLIR